MPNPTVYADLHNLPEDERVRMAGEHVQKTGQTGLIMTDAEPGKAERYIQKLRERYPDVAVLSDPVEGPLGVRSFRIGPKKGITPPGLTDGQIKGLCKIGSGPATCAYLMYGPNGFQCSKGTDMQRAIEERLTAGQMTAKGDNCSGPPTFTPTGA